MATIQITVPSDKVPKVLAAIGYQITIQDGNGKDIPNPMTGLQTAKEWLLNVVRERIRNYDADEAARIARQAALNQDLADIT